MKQNGCFLFRISRKQLSSILFLCSLILLPGCGGGRNVYYHPETVKNTINLQKIELSQTEITNYERQFFPVTYNDSQLKDKVSEEGRRIFGDAEYFQEVQFLGSEYYLHTSNSFRGVDLIRKKDMKKILLLCVPRNPRVFASFPIMMGNRNILAVYIEQQSESHLSTLFVIDSKFKIVYRENLSAAEEFGYTHSDKYGNCIVLKSEKTWLQNIEDNPRVWLSGDWLYYIPDENKKTNSEHNTKESRQ